MTVKEREMLQMYGAGCSAVSWQTKDGCVLWGRNMDFNRMAQGSAPTFFPRGQVYYTCGSKWEGNLVEDSRQTAAYAALGTGLIISPESPVLYEGINEKGLMGGQLYYREFAHYEDAPQPGRLAVQPPFVVYHLLAQCASVEEVVQQLQEKISLLALPMLGTVPSLHWTFCDRTGESIVVEPDGDGLHIYRRTIGVMTNSPSYSWHRLNLLNYAGLRDLDYDAVQLCGDSIPQCFSGSGMLGLPGDFSSPSRFVRLAMLKKCAVPGQNETDGAAKLFHLMQSAAFPLGAVRVSEPGHVTERDEGVVPFDYTLYTVVLCAQSLRCYWTSYENQRVQYLELERLLERTEPVQFDFRREPDFLCRNEG